MKKGEKLFKFLASLILREFYGTVTIRFEAGRVTHVETETRRMWRYQDLAEQPSGMLGVSDSGGADGLRPHDREAT